MMTPINQPVINATGVVIHTNLGRSPLGAQAAKTLTEIATGYCNLEFNLPEGTRGKRADYLESALAALLGADSATGPGSAAACAYTADGSSRKKANARPGRSLLKLSNIALNPVAYLMIQGCEYQ